MQIDAPSPLTSVRPAAEPLPNSPAVAPQGKLKQVCDQFEGLLLKQILQEGLKPMLGTPPGSGMAGSGMYDYLTTDALVNGITGKNVTGISNLLQAQLTRADGRNAAEVHDQ